MWGPIDIIPASIGEIKNDIDLFMWMFDDNENGHI
jgi:hypothetical protein